jgi:hypothetical protein
MKEQAMDRLDARLQAAIDRRKRPTRASESAPKKCAAILNARLRFAVQDIKQPREYRV